MNLTANLTEVDSIPRSEVDPEFRDTTAHGIVIPKIPAFNPVDPFDDDRFHPSIQRAEPIEKRFVAVIRLTNETSRGVTFKRLNLVRP